MSASIAGVPISNLVLAFDNGGTPEDGVYYALPPIGEAPFECPPEYDDILISYPGLDGVGRKRLGFRARKIHFELVFIGDTPADCSTTAIALFEVVTALERFTVAVEDNGGSSQDREGCVLVRGTGNPTKWLTFGTKVALIATMDFIQLSETN